MTDTETFLWIIVAFLAVVILFILMKKGGCRGGMQRLDSNFEDFEFDNPPPPPPIPHRFVVGDVVEVNGQPTREFTVAQDLGPGYDLHGRRSWQYMMSYFTNGVPSQIIMSDSSIIRKIR